MKKVLILLYSMTITIICLICQLYDLLAINDGYLVLISVLSATIGVVIVQAMSDARKKIYGFHFKRIITRFLIAELIALLAVSVTFTPYRFLVIVILVLLTVSVSYNQVRNYITNAGFFYTGSEWSIDKFFKRYPEPYYLFKILLTIGTAWWLISLY